MTTSQKSRECAARLVDDHLVMWAEVVGAQDVLKQQAAKTTAAIAVARTVARKNKLGRLFPTLELGDLRLRVKLMTIEENLGSLLRESGSLIKVAK